MSDLCTVQNVINACSDLEEADIQTLGSKISELIDYWTDEVKRMAENNSLTSENKNAKFACIYYVLSDLEKAEDIPPMATLSSFNDGTVNMQFNKPKGTDEPQTYYEMANTRYMRRLRPIGAMGGTF
jgi:hypothetical protein